jgi:hypothetical protein
MARVREKVVAMHTEHSPRILDPKRVQKEKK